METLPGETLDLAIFARLPLDDHETTLPPEILITVFRPFAAVPLQVPFDLRQHFQADLRFRLAVLNGWVLASPRGTLVLAGDKTHAIPREDPDLVVSSVRRVLEAVGDAPK